LLGDSSLNIGSNALKRLLLGEDVSRAASSRHFEMTQSGCTAMSFEVVFRMPT
jgi:hypothetical protein